MATFTKLPETNTNTKSIVNDIPDTISYSKKISTEEYNNQKDEFTQKSLKELNEQMKTFNKPKENNKKISMSLPNSDNDDKDNDNINGSDSDYTENIDNIDNDEQTTTNISASNISKSSPSVNFIIKHYTNEQPPSSHQLLKKRKIASLLPIQTLQTNNTMSDAIYAQHEQDMDTITKLKLKNNTLKIENEDLDTKKHFLTLELSNAQCEISDFKTLISKLKADNFKLKKFIIIMKQNDDQFELYLKYCSVVGIIVLLLIIYVFYM